MLKYYINFNYILKFKLLSYDIMYIYEFWFKHELEKVLDIVSYHEADLLARIHKTE